VASARAEAAQAEGRDHKGTLTSLPKQGA
jgi:hypothetical protein